MSPARVSRKIVICSELLNSKCKNIRVFSERLSSVQVNLSLLCSSELSATTNSTLSSISWSFEVEVEVEDSSLESAAETAFVAVFPLFVDDPKRDIFVRWTD